MRGSLADRMRGAGKEQDHKYQKKKKKKWLSEIILSSVSRMGWKEEIRCEETKWKPRAVDEEDLRWRGFKIHWAIILAVLGFPDVELH